MNTQQGSTVVGVFEDRIHANKAVTELHQAGFDQGQIGLAMRHAEGAGDVAATEHDSHATSGALAGALTGLGLGALAGLGVLAGVIPVVGPAIAAGTLGVVLSNAAAGAGIAGLLGALVGAGIRSMKPSTIRANSRPDGRSSRSMPAAGPTRRPASSGSAGRMT